MSRNHCSLTIISLIAIALFRFAGACGDPTKLHHWASERLDTIRRGHVDPCSALQAGNYSLESRNVSRPAVQVFLFQKDETELLADWLQYHSHLFGIKNINVVDHNSTDVQICRLLAMYSFCGARVANFNGSFGHKHWALTWAMRKHNNTLLIPLDADEFVVRFKKNKQGNNTALIIDRDAILDELAGVPFDGRKYKFNGVHPIRHNRDTCVEAYRKGKLLSKNDRRVAAGGYVDPTQFEPFVTKTFYYSNGFMETDQGNHYGKVRHDNGTYLNHHHVMRNLTRFYHFMPTVSLVHYHVMSVAHVRAKLERGAAAYGFNIHNTSGCGEPRTGDHYCHKAREYLLNTPKAKAHYMYLCQRTTMGPHTLQIAKWFKTNTLMMDELVGTG